MIHLNVKKVREDFPITRDVVYMNVANHSPPSVLVQNAVRAFLNDWDDLARRGDRRVEEACANFARLIGAEAGEVGCQPNTSMGLTMVAESLGWKRGDNMVTNDLENPANLFPWMAQRRRGVELRIIEGVGGAVRLEDVEERVLELGVELVSPVDSERRSGVVSFRAEGLPELRDRLVRDGFVISLRSAGIRVSTDFYNTEEEVEKLLEYLGKAFQ